MTTTIAYDKLSGFAQEAFIARGVPNPDAAAAADVIVSANLKGIDTHGVVRLPHYVRRLENGTVKARPNVTVESRAPAAFFGTNPIALGFPTSGAPLILDMATTSVPFGKLALAKAEGRPIPAEWGIDAQGHPTTDPNNVVGLHPIAGPKGSGLAAVIDVFSNLFVGAT